MGVSNYSMADIAGLVNSTDTTIGKNSTSRKGNTELTMQDFLQLMVVQLQNQSMDDTMDTGEMMNQMVQMQMVTAIANMNELSVMSYASSLVGKVVTIGITDGNTLEEREVLVIGTGMSNGEQVIFGKDGKNRVLTYSLKQIMAVGYLPPIEGDGSDTPGDGTEGPGDSTEKPGDGTEKPGDGTDKPVEGGDGAGSGGEGENSGGDDNVPSI